MAAMLIFSKFIVTETFYLQVQYVSLTEVFHRPESLNTFIPLCDWEYVETNKQKANKKS